MREILLTTLNARYAHASFGLRYLLANLGELRDRAHIVEFDINQRPIDVLEMILGENPKIVGIGVYIWNVEVATELVAMLKRVRPEICVVLGGPEVSHEIGEQEIVRLADYVIAGEGDIAFAQLCGQILNRQFPEGKIIEAELPDLGQLVLPYDLYSAQDIAHRVVYVEASRGCPFHCEFCLSSLDTPLRNVPTDAFLAAMQSLLDRGCRHFKFVDRTFNLNVNIALGILEFFAKRYRPGLFLHFEMVPDRLPEQLRQAIGQFPAGALQFEMGIQTFNEEVAERIGRRQDNVRVEENFRYLREQTGVHIHADLIAGLPGEDMGSFAAGFDRLVGLGPQEIQLGILKRLRGAPIARHTEEWGMVYSSTPPYEILQNRQIDFATLQRVRRFARYWDLIANSGNFVEATPLIWGEGLPFASFMRLSDWLFAQGRRTHGIALLGLAEFVFRFLVEEMGRDRIAAANAICRDYQRGGRKDRPEFLRAYYGEMEPVVRGISERGVPVRQGRHLGKGGEGKSE